MKKIIYTLIGAGMLFSNTACSDFLDTSSPSVVDPELVFSDAATTRRALLGAYANWEERNNYVHSLGLFYAVSVVGSDSERHAETYLKQTSRTVAEALFPDIATFSIDMKEAADAWTYMYSIIAVCNNVISSVESADAYASFTPEHPTELSQIYGEAVALRATAYFELLRYFGDIPHKIEPGQASSGFTPRDVVYEYHINKLIEVEPLMYRVGESSSGVATAMNRTYVQGLIGRYCLFAGGYSTRRTDLGTDFYKDLDGNTLVFEKWAGEKNNAFYGRRTDYIKFYNIARTYLAACVANPGTVTLITADERTASGGRSYGNPYQRKYQYMNDRVVTPESVYEITYRQGAAGSERPYSYGRGSDGGSTGYPAKSYGQSRFYPTYYYGDFDNNDFRRDVTVTITGSTGAGVEVLAKFDNGSKGSGGGLMNNKWDENRMTSPITTSRQSGISCLYMSFSDVILMLAEVYAELNEDGLAKTELSKVRNRAFASSALANVDAFISECGGIKEAIAQERKLEFGGEGYRRFDLIRTGKLPEAAVSLRQELREVIAGLESNGYYTFSNGNQMSNYIWVKKVDAKTDYGFRLTAQCTDENDPVLFPGWRGQNDDWSKYGYTGYTGSDKTNLAIKGLFKYIDPSSAEAAALEANGYTKTNWGVSLLNEEMKLEYTKYPFYGYTDEDFVAKNPPLYFAPLSSTTLTNDLTLSNGYGFAQK